MEAHEPLGPVRPRGEAGDRDRRGVRVISGKDGEEMLKLAEQEKFEFVQVGKLGKYAKNDTYIDHLRRRSFVVQRSGARLRHDRRRQGGAVATGAKHRLPPQPADRE